MLKNIAHVGITVSNLEKSIEFYKNVLGLSYQGQMLMEGEATERLFRISPCKVKVAYLNGSEELMSPPEELHQFLRDENEDRGNKINQIKITKIKIFKYNYTSYDLYENIKKI